MSPPSRYQYILGGGLPEAVHLRDRKPFTLTICSRKVSINSGETAKINYDVMISFQVLYLIRFYFKLVPPSNRRTLD